MSQPQPSVSENLWLLRLGALTGSFAVRAVSPAAMAKIPDGSCAGVSRPAADGLLYNAHRKFEAGRLVRAVQRSAAAFRWAVLDSQLPTFSSVGSSSGAGSETRRSSYSLEGASA